MRAVVYDRVSVRDEASQAEHLKRCRAFCKARGWRVAGEETDTASGFSKSAKRPGWDRVTAMVERGEVDAVVVFAVSRAGRNLARFAAFVELCRERGVVFASATEPIDTSGEFGRVFLALLSALAEMESATKRERTLVGRAIAKSNGTWTGGVRRFGFGVDDENRVTVVESEAAAIRKAVTDVLNGKSLNAVAREWNALGLYTTGGKPWHASHLRDVLASERNVPGIVTASDLARLNALMESRRTGRAPERYLLAGLVWCGVDGHRLTGRKARYACVWGEGATRLHLTVDQLALDNYVLRVVREREASHPFEETEARDPSDALVQERERLVAALEALGDSDLSEHVLRGRERRLLRDLRAIEEQLDHAAPKRSTDFWQQHVDDATLVRRYVRRIDVGPSIEGARRRFNPDRVRIAWA